MAIEIKNHAPELAVFVQFDGGNVFVAVEHGKVVVQVEDNEKQVEHEIVLGETEIAVLPL